MSTRIVYGAVALLTIFCSVIRAQVGGVVGGPPGTLSQPPRPGSPPDSTSTQGNTGIIRGRVVAADSGNPLRRAQVRINSLEGRVGQMATTEADGRYEFANLPAGRYFLTVSRNGFVSLQYGQQRPFEGGKPLELSKGQVAEKVDFALPRGGVIVGRLTDDAGEPVAGVRLQAMRYQYNPNGKRQLVPGNSGFPNGPFGFVTDDLGQFRIYGLMPGSYLISASAQMGVMSMGIGSGGVTSNSSNTNEGFVTTYYPGTANPDEAQMVTLAIAQEISIYFPMMSARMSRISGIVRNSRGQPASGMMISVRTTSGGMTMGVGGGQTEPNGAFRLENVPPGEHVLEVRNRPGPARPNDASASSEEQEFAQIPINANGADITNLVITTGVGATVSGRVVFQGTKPIERRTGQNATRIMPAPVDQNMMMFAGGVNDNGVVDEEGRFQIRGVSGRVFFRLNFPPSGWFLKSVSVNGTDITDTPFEPRGSVTGLEVLLTDLQTTISGTVKNSRGEVSKDYTVVILPDSVPENAQPQRFIRSIRPDQNGQFRAQGMPPGAYVALAVEALEPGIIFDPAYQQTVRPRGTAFRLGEGQSVTLELEVQQ